MLFSAFLTLSFGLLTLAAPQYPPSSPPGCGDPNHEAVRTPSTSDYAERPNVHPYANPHTHHWAAGKTPEYPVLFCNASETALIRQGLREAEVLAAHARDHIHRWGNASAFYTRYFGAAGTAEPAGWFDKIVHADKTGVVFRCDDPDGLCAANETWAGYWRGTNGTDQSSICAPSFTQRWPLDALCMRGWTVAGSPYNQFWASDLHHRLFHTAKIGEGLVDHYADDYGPSLQLAVDAPREAVRNSHSLAFFALDVYAFDVAAPDQGCTGTYVADGGGGAAEVESSSSSSSFMAMSTSSAPPAAIAAAATTTADELPTSTRSSDSSCHTHADGEIHCA